MDELPQLINVLLGHMSLVGPRPLVGPELENYGGRIPTLLSVKPGITGLWQVSGRSRVAYPERAEMDLEYVRRWSFLRDLWILALTPMAVLLRRGAH
jgi:lipopolysaccharide/colanic/teichoic acid biosynthesis glycosyltransferase